MERTPDQRIEELMGLIESGTEAVRGLRLKNADLRQQLEQAGAETNLRKEARGRECQIRIPHVCNGNSETVVLCHLNNKRLFGVGTGQKVHDIFGSWGCNACHDACDGRTKWPNLDPRDIREMHTDGVFRTINILLQERKI